MGRDAGRCCHAVNDGRRELWIWEPGMCVAAGARARAATALPRRVYSIPRPLYTTDDGLQQPTFTLKSVVLQAYTTLRIIQGVRLFFYVGNTLLNVRVNKSADFHLIVVQFEFNLIAQTIKSGRNNTVFCLWKVLLKIDQCTTFINLDNDPVLMEYKQEYEELYCKI